MKFSEWLRDTMGYSELDIETAPNEDMEDLRNQFLAEQRAEFHNRFREPVNPPKARDVNPEIGMWVKHKPTGEVGRIKSLVSTLAVFVVFKCNNEWDRYSEYTAQRTMIEQLEYHEPL